MEIEKKHDDLKHEKILFEDLLRRVRLTRKSRINASSRLRKKHEYYERVIYVYSLVTLILTIWFLNSEGDESLISTKMLLILSLSITYFTMYLNIKNYKERAGNFETNYQKLDILLNKLDREKCKVLILDDIKQSHREYEKLLIERENHEDIDYWLAYSEKDKYKFYSSIKKYRYKEMLKKTLAAIFPLLIISCIFAVNLLIYLFSG